MGEMTRQVSGSPRCGNCSRATCTASRSGTCSVSLTLKHCRKRKILSSLSRFSVSSCRQPPPSRAAAGTPPASAAPGPRRRRPAPPAAVVSKVPEQQKPDPAVHGELGDVGPQSDVELRDLLDDQPVQRADGAADGAGTWRHMEDPVEHCLNGHSLLWGMLGAAIRDPKHADRWQGCQAENSCYSRAEATAQGGNA